MAARVMLCGTCTAEDVKMLVEEGVDGIGLITDVDQDIACRLSRKAAEELCRLVPPLVSSVLVITEEDTEDICELAGFVAADTLHLHGYNPPEQLELLKKRLRMSIVKTLHVEGENLLESSEPLEYALSCVQAGADGILLDSAEGGKYGSTGRAASFELAQRIRDAVYPVPFILAGGLGPGNVSEAISKVHPFGVDAFSSVIERDRLDRKKVRRFITAVKGVAAAFR